METLIVMAKAPRAGSAKTRLQPAVSAADAGALALAFLQDTLDLAGRWQRQQFGSDPNRRVVVYGDPGPDDAQLELAAQQCGARLTGQVGETLGERMAHAVAQELDRGARAAVVIGTDAPHVPAHLLDEAFRALAWERVVLGPAFDGGYWLVGTARPAADVFAGIAWSTPAVFAQTVALLARQGLTPHVLPFWYDVDTPDDVARLRVHLALLRSRDARIAPRTAAWLAHRADGAAWSSPSTPPPLTLVSEP